MSACADQPVTAIVIFKPHPWAGEALAAAMSRNIEASRSDAGFMSFRRLRDIDDPEALVFLEQWASHHDLKRHLGTAHVVRFQRESAELLEHKEVRILVNAPE